ncbi:MAG: TatD family hydrolase [archaeon]
MRLLVDSHCHLDHSMFSDLDEVVQRARQAGVALIITNGANPEKNRQALEIASGYDVVRAALGIYPVDACELSESAVKAEIGRIKKADVIAIGEVGLDYFWVTDEGKRERQRKVFQQMIALARELDRPIIVHSRKAEEDAIGLLEKAGLKVIMHCFSGNFQLVEQVRDRGWIFSVPTNIVFSEHFQKLVRIVPMNQILTETDAPYLSPFKDRRNEPAFVARAVEMIAEVKGLVPDEVSKIIYMNYQRIFC